MLEINKPSFPQTRTRVDTRYNVYRPSREFSGEEDERAIMPLVLDNCAVIDRIWGNAQTSKDVVVLHACTCQVILQSTHRREVAVAQTLVFVCDALQVLRRRL